MKEFINYLERMIEGCNSLGGMSREKATYQAVLKEYRKQCNITDVVESVCDHNWIGATQIHSKCTKCGAMVRDD